MRSSDPVDGPVFDSPEAGAPNPDAPETVELVDSRLRASLSPSRAGDFKTCPLLYRLRSIDRIPEPQTADQARGTLVHAVLERLFDLDAVARTPEAAATLIAPQWERLMAEAPALAEVVTPDGLAGFLSSAGELLDGYFQLEDPRRLSPAERECLVATEVDDGRLQLRGYIDRLDVAPDGAIRVVDYKTGGAPREAFESRALFQLKFYALVLWRTRGVVPSVLRLIYLKDREICDFTPDVDELARFERTVIALWAAINRARETGEFLPTPSRLCDWCAHQSLCPAFGGTPPPYPEGMGAILPVIPSPATPVAQRRGVAHSIPHS
jgi:putative RecB family exonuclease